MATREEYEQKVIKALAERDEKDAEVLRLQTLLSKLAERDGVIENIKKQILDFDISAKELFPK